MKKSIILLLTILSISSVYAQNEKYVNAMKPLVQQIQETPFGTSLQTSSNKMERIAAAEPNEWLPNYWVAYCNILDSFSTEDSDKKELLLDKAEKFVKIAASLSKDKDEVEHLTAYMYNAKIAASPMTGWMKYGSEVETHIKNAKKINAANPRTALLEAESIYYTPSTFGGGKDKAKPMLEKALKLFESFEPSNEIMPNWGEMIVKYYLSQY